MSDGESEEAVPDEGSVFTDHFVLFLDFLGVSDAAYTWEEERAANLIEVLETVAAARAPFTIDGESLPDGSYKMSVTAETSTFSDHIVASYPLYGKTSIPVELWLDMYLKLTQDMVSKIAVHALNVGLLVRGGLTIGKLHHSDGVVFGEAMIDAHRLESRVAIFPRIAVSSRIYSKVPVSQRVRLLQDVDGIWHLNYFTNMLASISPSEREEWAGNCVEMIDLNIDSFEKAEKWNEFAKWSWFKDRFVTLIDASLLPSIDANSPNMA
jgi:hypothetical protein